MTTGPQSPGWNLTASATVRTTRVWLGPKTEGSGSVCCWDSPGSRGFRAGNLGRDRVSLAGHTGRSWTVCARRDPRIPSGAGVFRVRPRLALDVLPGLQKRMVDTLFAGWERGRGCGYRAASNRVCRASAIVCANGLVFNSSSMVRALGLAALSDVVMVEVSVVFMVVPIGFTRFVGSGIGSGKPSLLSGGARRGSRARPPFREGPTRLGGLLFFRNSHQAILQGGKRRGLDPARGLGGAAFFLASHAILSFSMTS